MPLTQAFGNDWLTLVNIATGCV